MTKILIPVEERQFAEAQIDFLGKHLLPPETHFTLLSVVKPMVVQDYGFAMPYTYLDAITKQEEAYASELLADMEIRLKKVFPNAIIEKRIEMDGAADEILRRAKEGKYDWIVIGSHGRSGLERFLLGSVSQKVVNHALCSVTVVRLPHADLQEKEKQEVTLSANVV